MILINRKRRNQLIIKENCKLVTLSDDDKAINDSLKGVKVSVLNGDYKTTVQDLQKILLKMGAQTVANAGRNNLII